MTVYQILKGSHWTCQWKCPVCSEENCVCKHDVPQDITSPYDLTPHLKCRTCSTNLSDPGGIIVLSPNKPHCGTASVLVLSAA
jgi:hypothetical protein